ncbi:MAG: YgjV family protein [Bacilli bacterium]|nr:YgjV family protein [Bacilli bacterium]
MNINFILIQLIGLLAGIILILSYFRKDTNKVLSFHIISNTLDFIHYLLLGAYSGAFIYLLEGTRDFLYYKTDKDKYIFIVSTIIYLSISFFGVRSWIDYLPILASIIDGYSLTLEKKYVTIGAIMSYSIWVIYNIYVLSWAGLLIDGIIAISNIIILLSYYKKQIKFKNKR